MNQSSPSPSPSPSQSQSPSPSPSPSPPDEAITIQQISEQTSTIQNQNAEILGHSPTAVDPNDHCTEIPIAHAVVPIEITPSYNESDIDDADDDNSQQSNHYYYNNINNKPSLVLNMIETIIPEQSTENHHYYNTQQSPPIINGHIVRTPTTVESGEKIKWWWKYRIFLMVILIIIVATMGVRVYLGFKEKQMPNIISNNDRNDPSEDKSTLPPSSSSPLLSSSSSPSSSSPSSLPPSAKFPSGSPSSNNIPNENPFMSILHWKEIFPASLPNSHSSYPSYDGYSMSLSYDGTILAVLNYDGISVWKEGERNNKWIPYGKSIASSTLIQGLTTAFNNENNINNVMTWDEIMGDAALITTYVTLSADGQRFMWDVQYRASSSSEGIAVIFEYAPKTNRWEQKSEILPLGVNIGGIEFGNSVAYARVTGDSVLVSSNDSNRPLDVITAVAVWKLMGNNDGGDNDQEEWTQMGNFLISLGQATSALFGASCATSGDGSIISIASPMANGELGREGRVQAFEIKRVNHPQLGTSFRWQNLGTDIWGDTINNNFGIVSISSNGHVLAVGTPNEGRGRPGQVRIFQFKGDDDDNGDWIEIENIVGPAGDNFGQRISLSPDGESIAIAAPKAGRICVYKKNSNNNDVMNREEVGGAAIWELVGECIEEGVPGDNYQRFSVSISENGNRLAVGVPPYKWRMNSGDGHVKIYELRGI